MTTAILVAGLLMVAALAVVMVRPSLRLPVLAFGLLAIPGNVDDLLPQLALDPHDLPGRLAPIVTFVDLLLAWAVVLTIRERRDTGPGIKGLALLAVGLAAVATVTIGVNLVGGLDPAAAVRGVVLFWRIPALFYLAGALRHETGNGRLLAVAIVLGGVALLGNGIYTTLSDDLDRFTARTFGRNGFGVTMTVVTVTGAALAFELWTRATDARTRVLAIACGAVSAACLFGMSATGTRMAFLVLLGAAAVAILLYPGRIGRRQLVRIAGTGALVTVVLAASVMFTAAGGRTLSILTDPDNTVEVISNPGDTPTEAEIQTRGQFWSYALEMAETHPLTGVGPFQWNFVRYELDPTGPLVVADSHASYLQIAAEYGYVVLALYLVLLAACALRTLWSILPRTRRASIGWPGMGVIIGAIVIPIAATTNAHMINPRNGPLEWLLIGVATALSVSLVERSGVAAERSPNEPGGVTAAVPEG